MDAAPSFYLTILILPVETDYNQIETVRLVTLAKLRHFQEEETERPNEKSNKKPNSNTSNEKPNGTTDSCFEGPSRC
jgi:hypothetical protein